METGKRILIVDDVLANIEVLAAILGQEYEVLMALSGAKALKLAATEPPPDLILLDVMMPDMDGHEVCRSLKQHPPTRKIPIIFVTAREDAIDEVRGLKLGAVDYLTKPVNPAIVEARVKTHLALSSAMNELEKRNDLLLENIRLQEDIERISNHDLKGPMTVFLNIPDMLMLEKNLTPDQVEMLQLLKQSALRLMELIHRTLDLYKMEKGTYLVKPVSVNVVNVLREICRELDGLARKKRISLVMRREEVLVGPGDAFHLQGEEPLFFSLLFNLIQNALEASPEGKEVLVTLSDSPQPSISIRNDGAIPPQIRARFLERYATFGKERGTGLGAYSARLMTRTLGGNLSFTSSESAGTTLVVTLPGFAPELQGPTSGP